MQKIKGKAKRKRWPHVAWPTVSHSPIFFSFLLCYLHFILFDFVLYFFGTIICQLRPRPWRKVFILINESRWSAESWFAFAFAVLLLAFHSISESYQFEFLLSLTRHSI